jgi:hypothetical protein
VRTNLFPDAVTAKFTRGTGVQPHTIASKLVVANLPVQSNTVLNFEQATELSYRALLYELHDRPSGVLSTKAPNWFGVALPTAFDLSGDVYVIVYFHPRPGQAGYNDADYQNKNGASGTDWRQLYAYVDRLGGQMAGAIKAGAKANRLVVFPFLKSAQYTVPTGEWFNIIHDILQDINRDIVPGICTRPKKVIVATISNGTTYLHKFLQEASVLPINNKIIEAWDFDTDIVSGQSAPLDPHNRRLRAYWQAQGVIRPNSAPSTYIKLPLTSWANFPQGGAIPVEIPPLPPRPSNSNPANAAGDTTALDRVHHYIRDTMFLDAVFNIESDNP